MFGAAADRWSRRTCLVVADLVRAIAFAGIVAVDGFAGTLALAVLAGIGTGLFTPAALASIPSLVRTRLLPTATSLYGAIADVGFTAGPAIAAAILLVAGPEAILGVNAGTFAVSALVLTRLSFGAAPGRVSDSREPSSLLREAREGLKVLSGLRAIRVVVLASASLLFFAGLFNVAELLFATRDLNTGEAGFSALAAMFGLGFLVGSLSGSRGGDTAALKRGFLMGVGVMGAGLLLSGLAPNYWIALVTFALAGFGNGQALVYERLLVQATVPDGVMARVFGAKDALTAWAFAVAFLSAGAIIALIGTRPLVLLAGAGSLAVWAISALALKRARSTQSLSEESGRGGGPAGDGLPGQESADLVGGREHWLTILDDLGDGGNDDRIELRPGVRE